MVDGTKDDAPGIRVELTGPWAAYSFAGEEAGERGAGGESTGEGIMTVVERREIALVDLLDRLLAGGVVITGDVTLRIADVDLVRIDLNALISPVNHNVPSLFGD